MKPGRLLRRPCPDIFVSSSPWRRQKCILTKGSRRPCPSVYALEERRRACGFFSLRQCRDLRGGAVSNSSEIALSS